MQLDFDVYFGPVTDEEIDWRKELADVDEPDDDESRPTDPDVIGILGFDPMEEFDKEEGGKKELNEWLTKGGRGSGNFGHEGRPGEVGGSGEERTSRGHLPLKRNLRQTEKWAQIKKDTGSSLSDARKVMDTVRAWTGKACKSIRSEPTGAKAKRLEVFIQRSPSWNGNGKLYRGIQVPDSTINRFQKGKTVDMKGISSWSSSRLVAKEFLNAHYKRLAPGKTPIIFTMRMVKNGTSIEHLTDLRGEKEVIVSGKSKFRILDVKAKTQGRLINMLGKKRRVVNIQVEEVV